MNVLFVALSRKRYRYFSVLSISAPDGIGASVQMGVRFSWMLIASLFSNPCSYPKESIDIHMQRQVINYPALSRLPFVFWGYRVLSRWLESVRYEYFKKLFSALGVDTVAVWNGQKPPYEAVVYAAKSLGLKIWYFENGALPGTTTLDSSGVNACSSISRDPDHYPAMEARESFPCGASKRPYTVFVPLQVESDTQLVVHSDWIKSNAELLAVVGRALADAPCEVRVVVRQHPLARTRAPSVDGVVFDSDTPLRVQLGQADLVVTINSTVGLEAVQLGCSVVVLGDALYRVEGVVQAANSVVELKRAIDRALLGGWKPVRARSFIDRLAGEYCIPGDWRRVDGDREDHIDRVWARITGRAPDCA